MTLDSNVQLVDVVEEAREELQYELDSTAKEWEDTKRELSDCVTELDSSIKNLIKVLTYFDELENLSQEMLTNVDIIRSELQEIRAVSRKLGYI